MNLLLRILEAWAVIDVIFVALWCHAAHFRAAKNDDAEQIAFLEAWEARHV